MSVDASRYRLPLGGADLRRRARSGIAALAIMVGSIGSAGAQASTCPSSAASILALRTEMMVAALGCDLTGDYNAVVRRHRRELDTAQRSVISWFRQNGGTPAFNGWMTKVANDRSLVLSHSPANYCSRLPSLLQEARTTPPASTALGALATRENVTFTQPPGCRG